MDRYKYSTIAHREHVIYSPVSEAGLDEFFGYLDLQPDQQALDVGCGRAEVLIRLIERFKVRGMGIDPCGPFLARARQNAIRRVPIDSLDLQLTDAAHFAGIPGGYDLVLCMGGPYGMEPAGLEALRRFARTGGGLLIGASYWKQEPDPAYLAATGIPRDELSDHATNLANAAAAGFELIQARASSLEEWDAYEDLYFNQVLRYTGENPDDPDVPAMVERAGKWRAAYLQWGRDTLGFALYLLRLPAS